MTSLRMFEPPPEVMEQYQVIYDLIRNESENGRLPVIKVAKALRIDQTWFRRAIRNRCVPFAFGDGSTDRAVSYIGVWPFWQYMSQGEPWLLEQHKKETASLVRG